MPSSTSPGGDQDYGWTWRSRTHTADSWEGEVCFLESDTPDDRRRIRKALSAELRSIPILFGLPPARVTSRVEKGDDNEEDVIQTAQWRLSASGMLAPGTLVSLMAGISIGGIAHWGGWGNWDALVLGSGSAIVGWYCHPAPFPRRAIPRCQSAPSTCVFSPLNAKRFCKSVRSKRSPGPMKSQ